MVLRFSIWGAACGMAFAVTGAAILYYQQLPESWNTRALKATNVKAQPEDKMNDKFDVEGTGIYFTADIENTTGDDVSLPKESNVMQQAKGFHALRHSFLKLSDDYFLPARHVTRIAVDNPELCAAGHPARQCFDSYLKDDEDIVIFILSGKKKYELHIPIPALTVPPSAK